MTVDTSEFLKKAFSKKNLELAWYRIISNPEPLYKGYFRHIYSAYGTARDRNLRQLAERLCNGIYQPCASTKVYFPKKSGVLRMYTLLTIEDQIVYQALANVIADKIAPKVRRRYNRSTFGHQYAGRGSHQFYNPWWVNYRRFTGEIEKAFKEGKKYSASFDLTAFYDSIDHRVLKHQLMRFGLDAAFCDFLNGYLAQWTASDFLKNPPLHGHGIPQGPLSSGLVAEVVLSRFDALFDTHQTISYFRYVDDIRILGPTERSIRLQLVRLDLSSKFLGLFPQSSKLDLHKIQDIREELKNISAVTPPDDLLITETQNFLREKFKKVTARFQISNETELKYILGSLIPHAGTTRRVVRLLSGHPHLHKEFIRYLQAIPKFNRSLSGILMKNLQDEDIYFSYSAALIDLLRERHHSAHRSKFIQLCRKSLKSDPELRAAASSALVFLKSFTWNELKENVLWKKNWWVRSKVIRFVDPTVVGKPSYDSLVNALMTDPSVDVAIVAADQAIANSATISGKNSDLNIAAQVALRQQRIIQRCSDRYCFIAVCMAQLLGDDFRTYPWKRFLGQHYMLVLQKMSRWSAYHESDSTAWITQTDTIMDAFLDRLFTVDGGIGAYKLGKIGSCLSPTSRFAMQFPKFYAAVSKIHELRLEADLSHAIVKNTGKHTRFIRWQEAKEARILLSIGMTEVWTAIRTKV